MKWTVAQKITAGFAVPLVILLAIGGVVFLSMNRLIDTASMQSHTHEVIKELEKIHNLLSEAQRGERGYVITGQDVYLGPYNKAVKNIPVAIEHVAALTQDNPRQQKRLADLRPMVQDGLAELERIIRLSQTQGHQAGIDAVRAGRAKDLMDRVRGALDEMEEEERDLLRDREAAAQAAAWNAHATLIVGTLGSAVLVLVLGWFITRSVTGPVRGVIAQLSATGTQLLATTTQQAAGAQEQAAAVAETVTTVDEVTQTSDQAAQRVKGVGDAIKRTYEIGRAGRKGAEDAIRSLAAVQEKMEATAENILALAEQAHAIGEIITTVNDIAEQTNVLALNAAIEASRAGHEGRGFAVVAGEVKALADQSKKATAQVRKILGEIQKATNTAVLSTEEVSKGVAAASAVTTQSGETIKTLADTLAEAAQAVEHVVASAGQQAIGMTQIHQAMRNIESVARQNVSALQQTESAARGLNTQGERLQALVGR